MSKAQTLVGYRHHWY